MPAMENAHALIVGIANYQHVSVLPNNVLDDARDLREVLVDPTLAGYPSEPVHLLLHSSAHRDAILTKIGDLAAATPEDGTAVAYFSCPGIRVDHTAYL